MRSFARRAFRKEVLAAVYDFNGGLKSKRILRATSEKPSSDKLINALLITSQIAGMRCWMDGRMGLVIILASAGLGESTAILKTGPLRKIFRDNQRRSYLEAKAPQAGSTACLAINDAKSNCGSY
jgi:hypothetical protein